jgi:hypothetical protein
MGIHPLCAWKRIELVTDVERMRDMTAMFGWTPGEVKQFPIAERAAEVAWVAA